VSDINAGLVPDQTIVRPNLTPPRGSHFSGEMLPDGRPIYWRERPIIGRRQKRDADGKILYHASPLGAPTRPVWETFIERVERYEFVLEPGTNGMTYINEHFRQTPAEIRAEQERTAFAAAQLGLSELAQAMQEHNISPTELVRAIRELVPAPPSAPEPDRT
jgi:hypothetical protein